MKKIRSVESLMIQIISHFDIYNLYSLNRVTYVFFHAAYIIIILIFVPFLHMGLIFSFCECLDGGEKY